MAKSPRRQTFADLAQEPTWSETDVSRSGQYALRAGGFSAAGEFFDPDGIKLRLVAEDATPDPSPTLRSEEPPMPMPSTSSRARTVRFVGERLKESASLARTLAHGVSVE
jgi:hypothetical protein